MRVLRKQESLYAPAWGAAWALSVASSMFLVPDARAQWTQFGGPGQEFKVEDAGIAKEWPPEGPRKVWSRKLGEGYSSILAHEGRLYTMYRSDKKEIVVSLDAETGNTLWEYDYVALPPRGHDSQYGDGPNATPLLADGRLYTIGLSMAMHCLESATGKLLWSRDLLGEFGGNVVELRPVAVDDQ